MENNELLDKLNIAKNIFIELCKVNDLKDISGITHKYVMASYFNTAFVQAGIPNYIHYWSLIKDGFNTPWPIKNHYETFIEMIDFMIRYSKFKAFL